MTRLSSRPLRPLATRAPRVVATLTLALIATAAFDADAATRSVGPGKTYATPCAAFAGAAAGDIVEIDGAATYTGDVCGIYTSNLTIRGVNGRPKINANGSNAMGKGTWVVIGNDVVIENVEMYGAAVPDLNGAALRLEGNNFTLRGSFLHDNENGILGGITATSNILIENTEFGHNGHGDGRSHNLYIGNVASLTFRYNYSHDANVGHNLKSRAQLNTITYNRFSSTPPGQTGTTASGQPSYEIDLPNAGTAYVIGNVIEQPSINQNPSMLAFGEEGATNVSQDLYVVNNTFLNDDSSRGTFIFAGSGVTVPVLMQNNIFAGVGNVITQVNAIDKTNYRTLSPAFVDRAGYNLTPAPGSPVIDAGSTVGQANGLSLAPTLQYQHPAGKIARPVVGAIDIGAYESGTAPAPAPTPTPTPPPTPTPTPAPTPAPAPSPAPTWTNCASENGTCSFSGTRQVRYGANGIYATRTASTSIGCNNGVFGDPLPGIVKSCQYASTVSTAPAPGTAPAPAPSPAPEAWAACATENGTCSLPGTRQVRYGAKNVYVTKIATGSIACNNATFGDPIPGVVKSCSYMTTGL